MPDNCGDTQWAIGPAAVFLVPIGQMLFFMDFSSACEQPHGMRRMGLYFYFGTFQNVSTTLLLTRSPILLKHFPKGLQYPLHAGKKVSGKLLGNFFLIFLLVPFSH
jgi:hypothetical protein